MAVEQYQIKRDVSDLRQISMASAVQPWSISCDTVARQLYEIRTDSRRLRVPRSRTEEGVPMPASTIGILERTGVQAPEMQVAFGIGGNLVQDLEE